MKYGFVLPEGDARLAADVAREAEEAGWDESAESVRRRMRQGPPG